MTGSTNAQKTPFNATQNVFVQKKIADAIQVLGKALPAKVVSIAGSIVTVSFEVNAAPFTLPQVTVPMEGCEFARPPIQAGTLGWVKSADARLGGVSGLGAGVANLTQPANLAALVFSPISNKNWSPTDDPNAYLLYGPNGFVFRNTDKDFSIVGSKSAASIIIKYGSAMLTVKDGEIDLDAPSVKINGKEFSLHDHTGVTLGSGVTGPVGP